MINLFPIKHYKIALSHRSYAEENGGENNERLEFLGDSVLQLCVTELLIDELKEKDEGVLSQARHQLVNNTLLAEIALSIGLDQLILLGKGEESSGGRNRVRMLANTFEAILGALYLHRGLEDCQKVIYAHFKPRIAGSLIMPAKRRLHEWSQKTYNTVPKYVLNQEEGPAHCRIFHIAVIINGEEIDVGSGLTKSEAANDAAHKAVERLSLR